jgi:hypothetical protein
VGAGEEVAEVDELAVSLVLDVDHAPAVLAAANLLAVDDDGLFTADNGEGDDLLLSLLDMGTCLLLFKAGLCLTLI